MKKISAPVVLAFLNVLATVLFLSGCATGRISGPEYQPAVTKFPPAVAVFLESKEVSITAQNGARGIIADAVLEAGGVPVERKKAEVNIRAEILRDSSSGYHGYSPVPLIPSGPAYRIRVEIWISENGAIRFYGAGADSYFDPGSISKTLATENATRYALRNLRGRQTAPR